MGTYVELVDKEVVSGQKELLLATLLGVLRARIENNRGRAVPRVSYIFFAQKMLSLALHYRLLCKGLDLPNLT